MPFTEIDVTEAGDDKSSARKRKSLADRVGRTSVPQIFVAGEHIGGCDELLAAVDDGSLEERLNSAGISREELASCGADVVAVGGSEAVDIDLAPKNGILNHHQKEGESGGGDQSAAALAQDLQARTLKLFDDFVTADGRGVGACSSYQHPRAMRARETG